MHIGKQLRCCAIRARFLFENRDLLKKNTHTKGETTHEEERRESAARRYEKDGYVLKPLAVIPELELKVYSRCIVCRMNADGELASLEKGDCDKFMKYLAE